jgi:L-lysine 2,3-aminomutase
MPLARTRPSSKKTISSAPKNWSAVLDRIRFHLEVDDIVVSGGDVSRLKTANISEIGAPRLDTSDVSLPQSGDPRSK